MATVQFDIDGVLADFMHGFTRLAVERGDAPHVSGTLEQDEWETYGTVPPDKVGGVWAAAKKSPWFWEELPPLVELATFRRIERLQFRHDVYFATNRVGVDVKHQTIRWLRHHGISYPTVVITARKGDTATALGAGYAIDDKAGNAIFTGYQPGVRSYVIDRPYNRFNHNQIGSKVRRVATVDEFITHVEEER